MFGDNQGANAWAHNAGYHSKTKHIHGRQRFITEMVEQGFIEVSYILTREVVTDILTKALPKDQYWRFMCMLGLKNYNLLRRGSGNERLQKAAWVCEF